MRKKTTNEQVHTQPQFRLKPVCAAVLLAVAVQTAQANPIGGTVAAGQASFATTGNTLNVTNTPGTIINWQGFSIGANEITHFVQQSASSAVLNRVISNNPSSILGTLQSNGRVFLINPGGIVFGAGATVDVAGMVASTLNLSNADFLAGRNHFTQVPGSANVSNAGHITAHGDGQGNGLNGGQIYLIAPDVENTGVITAPNGEILLAAGYSVDLVSTTNPNLRVNITAPAGDATNVGQLIAQSGSLGLFGTVVRNSGTVSADSATMQGGKIVFRASQQAEISGTVSATGVKGGGIEVLANQVGILGNASIDASGVNGGGTVLIGGDAHGANPNIQNAQITYVDATATIKADGGIPSPSGGGLGWGNGGKVVVWADNATQFNGSISAQGGALSGNGGWVEVSGKQRLGYAGLTDTRAANGLTGSLLLDPTDITISTAATTSTLALTNTTGTYADTTTATSNLNNTGLHNQLALSNVTVDTTSALTGVGNITVQNAIAWNSPYSLTLNATGNGAIVTNAGATINNQGYGGLTMQTANGSITTGAAITLAGGTFTATANGAAGNITLNAPISTGVGSVTLNAGQNIIQNAGGAVTGTDFNFSAQSTIFLNDAAALAASGSSGSSTVTTGNLVLASGANLLVPSNVFWNFNSAAPSISVASGTAAITMLGGNIYQNASGQTLTLGSNLTVNGFGNIYSGYTGNTLINNGVIVANVAGQTLGLHSDALTNIGALSVAGGTLDIAPNVANPWTNLGTINLAAGTLNLGGTFTATGLGTFNRSAGTTVNLTGTLDLGTTGSVDIGAAGIFGGTSFVGGLTSLSGGTILNGTITDTDATPVLNSSGGTLVGVTIGNSLTLSGDTNINSNLTLANGITFDIGNSYLYFNTAGAQTLGPAAGNNATLTMGGGALYQYNIGQTLTLGTGLTVNGYGYFYSLYGVGNTFVNNSTIDANVANQGLFDSSDTFINNGTISASAGGIYIGPVTFTTSATSLLQVSYNPMGMYIAPTTAYWSNLGAINLNAGALNLGGTFNAAGLGVFNRTSGGTTVNLVGTLDNTGATLDIGSGGLFKAGGLSTLSGTIMGGTVISGDGTVLNSRNGGCGTCIIGTLDGVTIGSSLTLFGDTNINSNLTLANGITFDIGNSYLYFNTAGAQTLGPAAGNNATLTMGGGALYQVVSGNTLTLGTGLTVNGYGGIYSYYSGGVNTLTNNGIIDANVAGQTLGIYSDTFTNSGTLSVTGSTATLDIAPTTAYWTNAGTINLSAGTLNLGGTFTVAGFDPTLGTSFTRSAGTTVNITGAFDLAGGSVDIGSAGPFRTGGLSSLNGGTIYNGTLTDTDATPVLNSTYGTLSNVTIGSSLTLFGDTNINNNLTLANNVIFDIGNSYLYFNTATAESIGPAAGNTATLTMEGGSLNQNTYGGNTLTLGVGLTVSGYGNFDQYYYSSGNSLMNYGTIDASVAGQTLYVYGDSFTNYSTMTASAGTLDIAPVTFTNSATTGILNVNGGVMYIEPTGITSPNWNNAGTINLTAGDLNLGGLFTTAGIGKINRTGGNVYIVGTLDNTTATLDIGSTGNFGVGGLTSLSGTLRNGTVISGDGTVMNAYNGTLDGVTIDNAAHPYLTLDASYQCDGPCSGYTYINNLTLANGATLNLTSNTTLYFNTAGAQSISPASGTATLTMNGGTIYQNASAQTLTLGAGLTVNGSGSISSAVGVNNVIVNNGSIDANAGYLNVYGDAFTNNGTMTASAGSLYIAPYTSFTNAAGSTLSVTGSTATMDIAPNVANPWTNLGTINLTAGTLNLGGTFTVAGFDPTLGTSFTRSAGTTVNITGAFDLAGGSVDIGSAGPFRTGGLSSLNGGTIYNGTLTDTDATPVLNSTYGTLSNVTIGSSLTLFGDTNINNLTLANNVIFDIGNSTLYFNTATAESIGPAVGNTATLTMEGGSLNQNTSGNTLTLGAGLTVSGYGNFNSYYGGSVNSLVNNGTIDANVAGQTLAVTNNTYYGYTFTNNNTMTASAGTLTIAPTTFTSGAASTLAVSGSGTLNIGTAAVSTNTLTMNGGTINGTSGTPTLTVSGPASFDGAPSFLNNVLLATTGTSTITQGVTGADTIALMYGAGISNGGSWTMANGSSVGQLYGTATSFTNTGTLTALGTADIAGTGFTNSGGVVIGTIGTNAVIANNGSWNITGLDFTNGLAGYTGVALNNNNSGTILVNDPNGYYPTTMPSILTLNNNGALNIQAGTLNLQGTYVSGGSDSITLSGHGILATSSAISTPTLIMSGGTLLGVSAVAPVAVSVTGTALAFSNTNTLDNVAFSTAATTATTQGTVGGATINLQNGATITNNDAWTMADGSAITQTGIGAATPFTNNGTLSVPTGTAYLNITTLAGTAATGAGTLVQNATSITNASAWDITGLTIISDITNLAAGTISVNDATNYYAPATLNGSLTNSGTVQVQAGTLNLLNSVSTSIYTGNTGSSINVSGGTLNLAPFAATNWSNAGTLNVSAGTANLGGAYSNVTLGAIHNTGGSVNLTGTLDNTTGTATLDIGATSGIGLTSLSGTITGGTITDSDTTKVLNSTYGTLDTVTIGSSLTLSGDTNINNNLTLANGITFDIGNSTLYFNTSGTQSISLATGATAATFTMAGGYIYQNAASQNLTLNTGLTVNGYGTIYSGYSGNTLTNSGTIDASVAYQALTVGSNDTLINYGTMTASAGTLWIAPTTLTTSTTSVLQSTGSTGVLTIAPLTAYWTNAGTINLNAGTLNLGGTFYTTSLGTFNRAANTSVNITGTLDLQSSATPLDIGSAGPFGGGSSLGLTLLSGGTILNGTLTDTDATPVLNSSYGTLDGVTIGDALNLNLSLSGVAYIHNNLTLASGATLNLVNYGSLYFDIASATQTISPASGSATITLNGGGIYQDNSSQTLNLGAGLTVKGYGYIDAAGSGYYSNIYNSGVIDASVAGLGLYIDTSYYGHVYNTLTNNGTLTASAGTLYLSPATLTTTANSILSSTASTSTLTIAPNGAWSNLGAINLTAGTLNLGGTFTLAGFDPILGSSFTSNPGTTVNLTGTMDLGNGSVNIGSGGLFAGGLTSLNYGTLQNGTITDSDATPVLNSTYGTLNNVTIGSNLALSGYAYINNTLALASGTMLNLGNSTLYFNTATAGISTPGSATLTMAGGSINNQNAFSLTLGTGLTVNGYGSIRSYNPYSYYSNSIVNNGTIDANVAGQTLNVGNGYNYYYGDTVTNNGTMSASAGTLSIAPTTFITTTNSVLQATGGTLTIAPNAANPWSNLGTINLAAGTLNLGGTFTASGLTGSGTFTRATGTTVNLTGTLDNTGVTVDIGSAGLFGGASHTGGLTSLSLSGRILNGIVVSNDGTVLNSNFGTLNGVTIGGSNLALSGYAFINNTLALANGTTLNLGNSTLYFNTATAGISTPGSAILTMSGGSIYQNTSPQTLTLGTGLTVNGYGSIGSYYYSSNSIVNNGTIDASVAGQTLNVGIGHYYYYFGDTVTNNGTLSASAGTLSIAPTTFITTTNSVLQATGGVLTIAPNAANPWSNNGTINVNAGTLNLGGTFTAAGFAPLATSFTRTAGTTVNLTGTLDNTLAPTTVVDIGTAGLFGTGGLTSLSGTILNGIVVSNDGTVLNSNFGTLDGVTIGTDLALSGYAFINNTLALANGTMLNIGNSTLYSNTASTGISAGVNTLTTGGNTATLTMSGGSIQQNVSSQTLTLGTGLTVNGYGSINNSYYYSGNSIVNNGTIDANVAGQTLSILPTTLINNSTMSASAGTLYIAPNTFTNAAGSTLSVTGSTATLDIAPLAFTNNGTVTASAGMLIVEPINTFDTSSTSMLQASGGTLDLIINPLFAWSNLGNINVSAGTLNLGGTFTTSGLGTVSNTGGSVNIVGTLDNSNNTVNIGVAGIGLTSLSGTILNGTITDSDTTKVLNSTYGTLDNVTIGSNLTLYSGYGYTNINNNLKLANGITFDIGNSTLYFNTATAENIGLAAGATSATLTMEGGSLNQNTYGNTLTLGAGLTVSGYGSFDQYYYSSGNSLMNYGTITAIGPLGQTLYVSGDTTNYGTMSAQRGTLDLGGNSFTNNDLLDANGGTVYIHPASYTSGGTTDGLSTNNGGVLMLGATPISTTNLSLSNGVLMGGTLDVTGSLSTNASTNVLDGTTLNTLGTVTQGIDLAAPFYMNNGAVINNSGTWTIAYSDSFTQGMGAATAFNNNTGATLTIASGTTSFIGTALNLNGGMIDGASAGALLVNGSFSQAPGTMGNAFTSIDITQTAGDLTVDAMGATGPVSLTALAGALTINNAITGANINLTSSSSIAEAVGGSLSTAGTLTTSAVAGTTLLGGNAIGSGSAVEVNSVANFVATDSADVEIGNTAATLNLGNITTGGGLFVTNAGNITIASGSAVAINGTAVPTGFPVSVSGALQSSVAGGTFTNNGTISMPNSTYGLILVADSMALAGGGGTISVPSSQVILNTWTPAVVTDLGTTTKGTANTLQLSQADINSITSPVLMLAVNNNLDVTAPISFAGTLNLRAYDPTWGGGPINETGSGSITAGTLITTSLGGTTLNGANAVGAFNATNITSGNIALTDTAPTLTISGISDTGGGIDTVNNTGAISVTGAITGASFNGQATAGVDLGTAGTVTESGTGNAIILNAGAGNFTDSNLSSTALSAASGNWLVYSTDPSLNNIGALTYNFKQYNTAYGGTILGTGNGFIYTLAPAVITVSLTGTVSKVYDGTNTASLFAGNFPFVSVAGIDGDTVNAPVSAAGSYDTQNMGTGKIVAASGSIAAMNGTAAVYGYQYSASGAVGTITQAALSVTANAASKTYNGLAFNGGNGVTYSGFVNNETSGVLSGALVYGGTSQGATNAGSYLITPSGLTTGNYTISYVNGALTVNTAPLSVTANAASKTYNGLAFNGGNGVTYSGFVNNETSGVLSGALVYGGTSQGATNAGSYLITPGGQTSGNYTISYVDGALTITPAGLTLLSVTANNASKTYGTTLTFAGTEITPVGLLGSDTISGVTLTSTGAVATANVGTYAITPGNAVFSAGSASNYTITYVDGQLTVTPRLISIVANATTKVYGDLDANVLTFTAGGSGFTSWDTIPNVFTGALSHTGGENVGTYTNAITQGNLAANANYTITGFTTNNLIITPASLTVAANATSKILSTTDPLLTYMVSGLKFTDTDATTLNGSLSRVPGETVDTYQINQGTLALISTNYTMTYVPASFTVMVPTVINEIVNISLLPDTTTTEDKPKPEIVAVAAETPASVAVHVQPLPMCK